MFNAQAVTDGKVRWSCVNEKCSAKVYTDNINSTSVLIARWSENRSIFNTPNPRLMNVSLLRDSKLLHGNEQRRGSRSSVRGPSRQPSMASLRPHSPTGSQDEQPSTQTLNAESEPLRYD
uniref:Uncharacterized protein n=1 Tax=Timema cristinae TaxID=61476 RepID=A0A7R9GS89_TIMCR|nr:unnamed protein product [Timema cristinae]